MPGNKCCICTVNATDERIGIIHLSSYYNKFVGIKEIVESKIKYRTKDVKTLLITFKLLIKIK